MKVRYAIGNEKFLKYFELIVIFDRYWLLIVQKHSIHSKMAKEAEEIFVEQIKIHEGIMHKLINIYIDQAEEKKDALQEIMLQAWKAFPNFRGDAKFSTWLYRIALNTLLNHRKKHVKRQSVSLDNAIQLQAEKEKANHELLLLVIKNLSAIDKMLITLHLDGYKNLEIAEIAGISSNHVNVKIHRIKTHIVSELKKHNDGY